MKYKLPLLSLLALGLGMAECAAQAPAAEVSPAENMRKQLQDGSFEISNYNTACYLALAGDRDLAFTYLKASIFDDGFNNLKTIENDGDLKSLHSDARWNTMLQQVKENSNSQHKLRGIFFNQKAFWNNKALETPYKAELSEEEKVAGLS